MELAQPLIDGLGRLLESQGVPRIGGRIFGALAQLDGERSLDELATLLQVSKGSVSTNVRQLERMGLVEQRHRPGDRRDHYALSPHGLSRVVSLIVEQVDAYGELLKTAAASGAPSPHSRNRLRLQASFCDHVARTTRELVEQWKERSPVA